MFGKSIAGHQVPPDVFRKKNHPARGVMFYEKL